MSEWWLTTWEAAGMVVLSVAAVYLMLIVYTRLAGLRSFSKMSSFDFAMTVALGSLFATTAVMKDPPLLQSAVAFAAMYAGQAAIALARRTDWVSKLVDNQPRLLMYEGEMLRDQMRKARVTESDLLGKLREANALRLDQVKAVVFETTGDISVLHSDDDTELDDVLLKNVIGRRHETADQRG